MPKNALLLIVLCIVFAWVAFFDSTPDNVDVIDSEFAQAEFPQFFMENFTTTQFNKEGVVEFAFSGVSAKHYQLNPNEPSDSDRMDIIEPIFVFFQPTEPPWRLFSEKGQIVDQGDTINLIDDVIAHQIFDDTASTKISTDRLMLKPRAQFAATEKPVMIDYPRAHYEGIGMEVEFTQKTFTLLSNVKGIHEPPQH